MRNSLPGSSLIGYLGPRGTHSEEAVGHFCQQREQCKPYPSIDAVIEAVKNGEVAEGIVPIENSLEGSVNITLDKLAHDVNLFITRETVVPIRHHLLARQDTGTIQAVLSHPQALAQCRRYLKQYYPDAELKAVDSTAQAAALVAGGAANAAAISSLPAAAIYGLQTIASDIQDNSLNATRFIALGPHPAQSVDGRSKTSIVCQINGERPGSLCDILKEFADREVNLTRIESRPARTGLGIYIFFLDVAGCSNDSQVFAALEAVQKKSIWFKNLGSYPSAPLGIVI